MEHEMTSRVPDGRAASARFIEGPWPLIGVLIWGLLLRIALAPLIPPGTADAVLFKHVGAEFWKSFELRGLYFHMPLYPIIVGLLGPHLARGFDVIVSLVTVVLVYRLSLLVFRDRLAAFLASFIAASYPLAIAEVFSGLSDTLFAMFVIAAFVCWYEDRFLLGAICSVLAILTRPVFDPFAPLLIVAFCLYVFRRPAWQTARELGVYAAVYVCLMAPWWLQNWQVYGHFVRLVPMSAAVLYIGNNPMNKTGAQTVGVDFDLEKLRGPEVDHDPIAANARLFDEAVTFIRENPGRFLWLAVKKAAIIWRPWPIAPPFDTPFYVLVNLLSTGPVILLAVACFGFASRQQLRLLVPVFLFIVAYTVALSALAGATRYRLPLEPLLFVLAGTTLAGLCRKMGFWPQST
jgi:4-amino-4-deoxy-L-arabinose transferase-like glycosyltransferase